MKPLNSKIKSMQFKQFTIDFQNIGQQEFLRPNVGYRYFFDVQKGKIYPTKQNIKLKYVLKEIPAKKVFKGELEDSEILVDIGNIERRFNNLIDLEEVNKVGSDKSILRDGDIVIPKMQPQMGNIFLNLEHKRYIGSTELLEYSISENTNPLFLYYLITSKKFLSDLEKLESGKTHRRVNPTDLLRIEIPLVPKQKQDQIVAQIEPIEKKIKELKGQTTPVQEIINKVFARVFKFDLEEANETERARYFSINADITHRNLNLRSSVRWNKIKPIQQVLYKDNPYIDKLEKIVLSTKNGWSPNCRETDTENCVFGVNSISKDGYIKFEDLKFSDESKNNIREYFAKENDLFVSRGNTIDLVALASIVKNIPDEQNYIFPDLFIKIEVDTERLNKEYLALLFNSIIGRFYFKYSAKGKNQTMVKISSEELNNFYLPVPPIKMQQKIVDEIQVELDTQEEMKQKIESERDKIDKIIEKSIC